jgi:hypothetical protein
VFGDMTDTFPLANPMASIALVIHSMATPVPGIGIAVLLTGIASPSRPRPAW